MRSRVVRAPLVQIDPAVLRFLRSFVMLVFMWHVMGCAYWFVVRSEYNGTVECGMELVRMAALTGNATLVAEAARAAKTVLEEREGELVTFDPSFVHESVNRSAAPRVVLYLGVRLAAFRRRP